MISVTTVAATPGASTPLLRVTGMSKTFPGLAGAEVTEARREVDDLLAAGAALLVAVGLAAWRRAPRAQD